MKPGSCCIPLAVLLLWLGVLAAPTALWARPSAELITMGPGDMIWARFGHTGIRITDPVTGRDEVFNYGYAPFGGLGFLWGFIRGEARFLLVVRPWERTIEEYIREDRTLTRQPLNLTPQQTHRLVRFLEWNAQPENREYLYDHLRDNCSTRVRDLLDAVAGGALRTAVGSMRRSEPRTYRHYTLDGGRGRLDALLGMDLIGGPNQEKEVGRWDLLYLPAFLQQAAAHATNRVNGRTVPLAQPLITVYQRIGPPPQRSSPHAGRYLVLAVGIGLGALFLSTGRFIRRRPSSIASRALTRLSGFFLLWVSLLFGLVGAVLTFLMVVSLLPDFRWNENALVFVFLDFGWCGLAGRWLVAGRGAMSRFSRHYLDFRLLVLLALVIGKLVGLFTQDNWAFIGCAASVVIGLRLGAGSARRPQPPAERS
ncbi:MAG: DUF4105 domain-containing protein [Bradymonadales bacterium]|nr:DUF4105 domain-containing protein [Bradymonadales bacterium]